MVTDITKKGTPVPTRMGIIHVGDLVEVVLYENSAPGGGTKLETYTGELEYHQQEFRFLVRDAKKGLLYNLNLAEKIKVVKAWDAGKPELKTEKNFGYAGIPNHGEGN